MFLFPPFVLFTETLTAGQKPELTLYCTDNTLPRPPEKSRMNMSLPLKTLHEGKQSRSWDFLTWTIELVFRQPVSVPTG